MCARLFVDMGNFSPKFSRPLDSKGLMLTRGGKSGHAVKETKLGAKSGQRPADAEQSRNMLSFGSPGWYAGALGEQPQGDKPMDKKVIGLVGAISGLASLDTAQAATAAGPPSGPSF
jgi:hypothetical protein